MLHLPTLLTQIAVILVAARGIGWLLRRLHQPQVVGEMIAGILLGPSLLGFVAPGAASALFPEESLPYLAAVSQLGIVIFMFLMGLEVEAEILRGRGRVAVLTSQVGILAPFASGAILGIVLYSRLAPRVSTARFSCFSWARR